MNECVRVCACIDVNDRIELDANLIFRLTVSQRKVGIFCALPANSVHFCRFQLQQRQQQQQQAS